MEGKAQKTASILSFSMFVMVLTHVLTHSAHQIHTVLFPIWREPGELNLTLRQMGLIAAIPSLLSTLLSIPAGLLSDRMGSKKMMLLSMSVAVTGVTLASRAPDPAMIILAVSLISANSTIYHPPALSFTSKLLPGRDRPKVLGIHSAGGTLGMSIGPISVGILMGALALEWRQVYFFWSIPIMLGMTSIFFLKREPTEETRTPVTRSDEGPESTPTRLLSASLIMFLVFGAIRWLGQGLIGTFLSIYLVDALSLRENLVAMVLGATSLLGILATPLGGFLTTRWGEKNWMLTVFTLACVFFGLALLVPHSLVFVGLYMAYRFFNVMGMPANIALIAKLSSPTRRGLGYSLSFLPGSLVRPLSSMLAAHVAESLGLYSNFAIGLAILLASLLVLKLGVRVD